MARLEVSSEFIVAAMQSAGVRAALKVKAEAIQSRAKSLADAEETRTQPPTVESGTRPQGRPYSRVVIEDGAAQEYGTSRTGRRRILGRAAGL